MKQQHFGFINEEAIDWRIDDRTKTIGRIGIAAARATLAACRSEADQLQTAA